MIVGLAGHIDHGKTALVKALTGVEGDRLKEEKARGVTIDLGFAYLPVDRHLVIGFIDAPGHEKLVRAMLAGAGGVDFALLTIAADDGIMPQTREHLAILDLLGVSRGIVAMTKSDLVGEDRRAALKTEIDEALRATSLAGAEIFAISSLTGEGVAALRSRLVEAAGTPSRRPAEGRFRLAVDRSFTLQGVGVVVTGTILSGRVDVGDHVMASPTGLSARVRSLHAQNRPAESAAAGERCALNLAGPHVSREAIRRGDMIVDPVVHAPASRVDAKLRLLPGEPKPLASWRAVRLHHASVEVGAHVALLEGDELAPGGEALVQLALERPIAAAAQDRFVIRDVSGARTIGGGRFVDLRGAARKRHTPEREAQRAALAVNDPAAAFAALLETPPHAHDLAQFARDRALGPAETQALAEAEGRVVLEDKEARIALSGARWSAFEAAVAATLQAFHAENPDLQGMGKERLRVAVEPRLPARVFLPALRLLARRGALGLVGSFAHAPGHEARFAARDDGVWARLVPLLGGAERFRPPRVRDLAGATGTPEADVRRVLKTASRMGRVDEIAHDHFFMRSTTHEMTKIITDVAAGAKDGEFTAAELRDRLDNGRKVAIQILEFFDRHGVTTRRGDLRRVDPRRLDLFAPLEPGDEKAQAG
ncbi:selenocysteine-specific translation elongation factor [Methylocella sp.]|uniref:selenocysteine-specific translation elongation factor n=1 Tax=Methylocella sp. TaxID=1978226 RepID=UPI003784814C